MSAERITLHVDMAVTLVPGEVFPDGVPSEWGVDEVAAAVRQSRSFRDWLRDWCLDDLPTVIVTVDEDQAEVTWR